MLTYIKSWIFLIFIKEEIMKVKHIEKNIEPH